MKKINHASFFLCVTALAVPSLTTAHTLTLDRSTTPARIVLAHNSTFDEVPFGRITRVAAIDARGQSVSVGASPSPNGSIMTAPSSTSPAAQAWWIAYDGPPSGKGPNGERRPGPRGTHGDATDIGRSQVFGVVLANPRARVDGLPLGRLSLLPDGPPPRVVRVGTPIRLKVLYNGSPLANAVIRLEAGGAEIGGAVVTTNAQGQATARIPNADNVLFAVSYLERPSHDLSVDSLRLQATLGFQAQQ